jgi:hypothetical protein
MRGFVNNNDDDQLDDISYEEAVPKESWCIMGHNPKHGDNHQRNYKGI